MVVLVYWWYWCTGGTGGTGVLVYWWYWCTGGTGVLVYWCTGGTGVLVYWCTVSEQSLLSAGLCRRPSQWLGPGVTALTRMVSSSSLPTLKRAPAPQTERGAEEANEEEPQTPEEKPRPLRYQ